MPNHCRNRVEIYGKSDQIKEVKETLAGKKTCFDFNNIVPMPEHIYQSAHNSNPLRLVNKEHVGVVDDDWYDWCCENWDTKWNSYEASLEENGEENLRYEFLTAWAPPQNVIIELREKFPKLSITAFYDEPGMEAAGYY